MPLRRTTILNRWGSEASCEPLQVNEIDPLACPKCGGEMKVVAFIEPRAPERSDGRGAVIEKILRHCGG